MTPLPQAEIESALSDLPGWSFHDDAIHKTWKFADFKGAMGFIVKVALHAEQHNHHPELFNVYSTVRISLNTHDAGSKVTAKDIALAKDIDSTQWISRKIGDLDQTIAAALGLR